MYSFAIFLGTPLPMNRVPAYSWNRLRLPARAMPSPRYTELGSFLCFGMFGIFRLPKGSLREFSFIHAERNSWNRRALFRGYRRGRSVLTFGDRDRGPTIAKCRRWRALTFPLIASLGMMVSWIAALRFAPKLFWFSPVVPWGACLATLLMFFLACKELPALSPSAETIPLESGACLLQIRATPRRRWFRPTSEILRRTNCGDFAIDPAASGHW
jgi:hypothetical protein